ncbi:MAG: DUF2510 domain-containing protein [Candidatus Nanopelagicales bacterium]
MTVPVLPPAGWYPDPDDSDGERYWSGDAWSDDKRARPGVAESAEEAEAIGTPAPRRKKRWRDWGAVPLAGVVDELHSDDPATRIAAAKKLGAARSRDDAAERFEVEIECLDDPVPEVRIRALQMMAVSKEDRKRLVTLLLSDQQADAPRKASVLTSIAETLGPDSLFHGVVKTGLQGMLIGNGVGDGKGVFDVVIRKDHSAATTLPLLEVAGTLGLAPRLFTPWERDPATNVLALPTFHWPDRCCECGLPHPQESKPLPISTSWHVPGTSWDVVGGTETVTGTLSVPVCARCGSVYALPSLQADDRGLTLRFSSPAFVAELLDQGTWTRADGAWVER